MEIIVSAIVGGFLAAGTGWLVQSRLEKSKISRLKNLLIVGITDDLTNSLELYDQISEGWERSRIVWFNLFSEIADSRHVYVNNRDSIVLLDDSELRTRILQYYRKSGNHLLSLQNAQQRTYDIQDKYNHAVESFQLQDRTLTLKQAKEIVAQTMSNEGRELTHWKERLPSLVAGIQRFKEEAHQIREDLIKQK